MNIEFTGRKIATADGGFMFEAKVDGKPVTCQVSMETLRDHFGVDEDAATNTSPFDRGRDKIYQAAERLIREGIQPVVVLSADIA
jgi:hypothetical protein